MSKLRKLLEQKNVLIVSAILAIVIESFLVGFVFAIDWFGYAEIGQDVSHLVTHKIGEMTFPMRQDFGIDLSGATWRQFLVIMAVGFPLFFGLMLWQCGTDE